MAPETSILSGPEGPLGPEGLPVSTSGSATFEFWTDQPDAITQCSVDGDPWFFCESPLTVGPLEEGDHEFWVQGINEFGWIDLTPAIYEWEILGPDITPPMTVITNGPPEGSETPNFISFFEFSGTDDMTPTLELEFECTLNGVNLGGCDPVLEEIEVLGPGPQQLVVQAIDAAGNIDPVGAVRNWTVVDMSGPDTEIILGPEEETTETSATFEFEGFELLNDDPVSQFESRARRRRLRSLHHAAHDRWPTGRRSARLPRPRGRPRRQPGHLAGVLRVADPRARGHHAARDVHHRLPGARQLRPGRHLRLRQQRARRVVRVRDG